MPKRKPTRGERAYEASRQAVESRIGEWLVTRTAERFVLSEEKARDVVAFVIEAVRDDLAAMGERTRRTGVGLELAVVLERLDNSLDRLRGTKRATPEHA